MGTALALNCSVGARRSWPTFDGQSSSFVVFSFSRSGAAHGKDGEEHVSDKCSDVKDELVSFVSFDERSGTFGERVEGLL